MNSQRKFDRFRPHPWHGIPSYPGTLELVNVYVEITPFDLIKYEVDKTTGYLKVDRPQRTSSQPPALYGFIPQTYCGELVRELAPGSVSGDGDPLDICVISERPVTKSDVLIVARPIGGLQMIDHGEADDKIVAVLDGDFVWGHVRNITELPEILLERLQHYFLTYKLQPGSENMVQIQTVYDQAYAAKVIAASVKDYQNNYTDQSDSGEEK